MMASLCNAVKQVEPRSLCWLGSLPGRSSPQMIHPKQIPVRKPGPVLGGGQITIRKVTTSRFVIKFSIPLSPEVSRKLKNYPHSISVKLHRAESNRSCSTKIAGVM